MGHQHTTICSYISDKRRNLVLALPMSPSCPFCLKALVEQGVELNGPGTRQIVENA